MERKEERNYVKEALTYIPIILGAVLVFGCVCDGLLNSEAKARQARKEGYDV